jgi:hypothetical protein
VGVILTQPKQTGDIKISILNNAVCNGIRKELDQYMHLTILIVVSVLVLISIVLVLVMTTGTGAVLAILAIAVVAVDDFIVVALRGMCQWEGEP